MRKKKIKKEIEDSQIKELMDEEIKLHKEENKEKQEKIEKIEDTEVIYGELEG